MNKSAEFVVRTYNGAAGDDGRGPCNMEKTFVSVEVGSGIDLFLGLPDEIKDKGPSVYAERRLGGWVLMLRAAGSDDMVAQISLLDDGRGFIASEELEHIPVDVNGGLSEGLDDENNQNM